MKNDIVKKDELQVMLLDLMERVQSGHCSCRAAAKKLEASIMAAADEANRIGYDKGRVDGYLSALSL